MARKDAGIILLLFAFVISQLQTYSASRRPTKASNVCLIRDIFATTQCQTIELEPPAKDISNSPFAPSRIYLLYDVSEHEGFNLRRDVYIRLAVFVRFIRQQPGWSGIRLVLPPFYQLPHWSSATSSAHPHFWHEFFDLPSMRAYVPIMDAWQYHDEIRTSSNNPNILLNVHYVELKNYEMWDGQFADRYELQPIVESEHPLHPPIMGGLTNYTAVSRHRCIFQGSVRSLKPLLEDIWYLARRHAGDDSFTVYVRNAEIVLHDRFGDVEYWRARRSMRFASTLHAEATTFRRNELNQLDVDDDNDNELLLLQRPSHWQDEKVNIWRTITTSF